MEPLGFIQTVHRRPLEPVAASRRVVVPSGKVISVPRRVLELVRRRIVSEHDGTVVRLCVCVVVLERHFRRP